MSTNQKYFLGKLKVRCGEYVTEVSRILVANSQERAELLLDTAASFFYGEGDAPKEDNGYYANGGELHISAGMARPISFETFLEMKTLLPVTRDDNIPQIDDISDNVTSTFKQFAKNLGAKLTTQGVNMSHSSLLEMMAASLGQKNWQVLHETLSQVKESVTPPSLPELAEVIEDSPGMYEVEICRSGYGMAIIPVHANNALEAEDLAHELAGNYAYNEKHAEYSTEGVRKRS
ncbi:MAG: glyoxalase superfamily protein [Agitococcus sp.]|nr:glyoxalase superfamily protein [Agitococcus sp.]